MGCSADPVLYTPSVKVLFPSAALSKRRVLKLWTDSAMSGWWHDSVH